MPGDARRRARVARERLEQELRAAGRLLGGAARRPADGAAPLIGSSEAIRRVRERIERVAATDFTILIEGESGPERHPGFIEVFDPAAVGWGQEAVAGAGRLVQG